MSGRVWLAVLAPLLAVAVAGQAVRAHHRVEASRIVRRTEGIAQRVLEQGGRGVPALVANLRELDRAAELDPSDPAIPLARGSHHLLLGRPGAAEADYRRALELEPRAEAYLNLGRALSRQGKEPEARERFRQSMTLDPGLASEVQAELRRIGR